MSHQTVTEAGPKVGDLDKANSELKFNELKGLITKEDFDQLKPDQQAKIISILNNLKDLEGLLWWVKAGESILWVRKNILEGVYKIWDSLDPEFGEILAKIASIWGELSLLGNAEVKIKQKTDALRNLIENEIGKEGIWYLKVFKWVLGKNVKVSDVVEWKEFKIWAEVNLPEWYSLWKILPFKVQTIQIWEITYSRVGTGNFVGPDKKFLDFDSVKGKSLKIIKIQDVVNDNVDWWKFPDITSQAIEDILKKPEYKDLDPELIKDHLESLFKQPGSYSEVLSMVNSYDESLIKSKTEELIIDELTNILSSKNDAKYIGLFKEPEQLLKARSETLSKIDIQKKLLEDLESKTNPSITKLREELQVLQNQLTWLFNKKDWSSSALEIQKLQNQILEKQRQIDALKKSSWIDTVEIEIKRLESTPEIQALSKQGIWQIARSPHTWPDKAWKVSWIMKILNDFLKKFLGIDLMWMNDAARQSLWSIVSWTDSRKLWSLSERFESGWAGPSVITYNDANKGFPSYGTYQMNRDTLLAFAKEIWMSNEVINWEGWDSKKGGYLDTTSNNKFAKAWLDKINEPWFKEKEFNFVKKTYFDVQSKKILSETQVDIQKTSLTFQNIVWSCAVQHGANSDLISTVLNNNKALLNPWSVANEKKLIEAIYTERTSRYQNAGLEKRYREERGIALAQLEVIPSPYESGSFVGLKPSFPIEYKDGVTTCSRTAVANAENYWLSWWRLDTARNAENYYRARGEVSSNPPTSNPNAKFADIYSESTWYPNYGHRAFAVNHNGNWFVLDPYLRIWGRANRTDPIPWATYSRFLNDSWRYFRWARYV